jgi:hypothetical protein
VLTIQVDSVTNFISLLPGAFSSGFAKLSEPGLVLTMAEYPIALHATYRLFSRYGLRYVDHSACAD